MPKNPKQISLIGSRAVSVLSIALALVVVGIGGTLWMALRGASARVGDETTILVTMSADGDPYSSTELRQYLAAAPWAERVEFADAATVLSREIESVDSITRSGLDLLTTNPYGDEFVIFVSDGWRSTDSLDVLTRRIRTMTDVDIVSGESTALGEINDGMKHILAYGGLLALVLLVISVVLINNTISLSIYSRRFNIHTMRLVGATDAFIRRPFVRAGVLTGVAGGLIASLAVCGVQIYLMMNDALLGEWLTVPGIALTAPALVVLGAIIAGLAARRAVSVYLRKSFASLNRS